MITMKPRKMMIFFLVSYLLSVNDGVLGTMAELPIV